MAIPLLEQTQAQFLNIFNHKNLTAALTQQDVKDAFFNSALFTIALIPGTAAAATVTWIGRQINLSDYPMIDWVKKVITCAVASAAGITVNYWFIKNVMPSQAFISSDKAVRIESLVVIGSLFYQAMISMLPSSAKSPILYLPLPLVGLCGLGATVGCFPASSLYVCGALGPILVSANNA